MKRISILLLVVFVMTGAVSADILFKSKSHQDEIYHHGNVEPGEDSESEIWVGEEMMAYIADNRHFIFDLAANKLTIMEFADTAYVETDLPLDMTKIIPPEVVPQLAMYPYVGEVKPLDDHKKIKGKKCKNYMVHYWIDYNGMKYNETERKVWASDDAGVGEKHQQVWMDTMFKMYNFSPELIEQIKENGGWELLATSIRYTEGQQVNSSDEVTEIKKVKKMKKAVYTVPEHYRKKDYINPRG